MADIERYMIEDSKGNDLAGGTEYDDYAEAKSVARALNGRVIAYHYVFEDSEMVDDFTEDDEPPYVEGRSQEEIDAEDE